MSREGVRVLHLFGRDYSIKTPEAGANLLNEAIGLLQTEIASNEQRYPKAAGQELLLLSALNLLARQLAQASASDVEPRLQALNQLIQAQLQDRA